MISALFRTEWAVTPEALERMIAFVERDGALEELREKALAARNGEPLKNTRTVENRDGVAVIPISGPLFRHADMLSEMCGATSYATLRKDLQVAADDAGVHSIVLSIDSPGGEVNGVAELAGAVRAMRGQKPIVAYVGGIGASAAYWIASAADKVVAAPTAQLGSIGVMATYTDGRKAEEASGKKAIVIRSSQSPNKNPDPTTDAGMTQIQRRIDAMARVFISDVANYRGVSAQQVLTDFGKGDVFVGADAVAAGLADEIGNFEAVLADLAARQTNRSNRMFTTQLAALFGLDEKATEEQILERAAAAAKIEKDIVAATGATNADEAIGTVRATAGAVAELAAIRENEKKAAAEKIGADFRALLTGAVGAGGRLSLGQLTAVVPTLLDDEKEAAKVTEKITALEKQDAESVLACFADVKVGAKDVARVTGFVKTLPPLPTTVKEPSPDENGGALVDDAERRVSVAFEKARAQRDANKK